MPDLTGKVAVVTGASRGVGKGVALGLGEAGATVYITGRTIEPGESPAGLPGTIYQTAEEVSALGGRGIPMRCDHRLDHEVDAVFRQVIAEQGRIDILVNNVWGGYEPISTNSMAKWQSPFWEQPVQRWDAMFAAGVRAHYVASMHAAKAMVAQRSGLIVNISFFAGQKYMGNVAYGVAKAADDKMAADMAHELRDYNVATVSLYPGLVRTEDVLRAGYFDLSDSESPRFIGRAVAALAADPAIMDKSGHILVAAALAREYGFTDIDGKQPRIVSLEDA